MNQLEIPKPVAFGIAGVLAVLILIGIWWRTSAQMTGDTRDIPGEIARQEAQEFRNTGSPTTTQQNSELPPRD